MHREFVYVGSPVPKLTGAEYEAFILKLQTALLASLKKRELLNHSQYIHCIEELKKGYCSKNYE